MPDSTHVPYDYRKVNGGANRDENPHIVGLQGSEVADSLNMRSANMDGLGAGKTKIKGEEVLHAQTVIPGDYKCIGAIDVNRHIMEFWADKTGINPSLIRIDGVEVLKSINFPITWDKPLQISKNESCIGGEVYPTDNFNAPMIFNIQDLIDNSDTNKYFSLFNFDNHRLQLALPPNHPRFIQVITALQITNSAASLDLQKFGTVGLPVSLNQYSIRYSTDGGDKTSWSLNTPLIPVPKNSLRDSTVSTGSTIYPGHKQYSAASATTSPYGIYLRIRIDNKINFGFIEIRRIAYNTGTALGFTPDADIIAKVAIADNQISIYNFVDFGAASIEVVPNDEVGDALSVIESSKAIRYFGRRLSMWNLKFASRDVGSDITFKTINGKTAFPVIDKMGGAIKNAGHADEYNFTYLRSDMRGDKKGFSFVGIDFNNQYTFAAKIPGAENILFPNRREALSAETITHSYNGTVKAADEDGNVSQTAEVFTNEGGVAKTNSTDIISIYNTDAYKPLRPAKDTDTDSSGHNYIVNTNVNSDLTTQHAYTPDGFAPDLYTMGIAIAGVENIPSYIKSFTIVPTLPANRVFAQGIAIYEHTFPAGSVRKETDQFRFFSSDIDNAKVDFQIVIDDVLAAGTRFKIQVVSPLGFYSEVFNADFTSGTNHKKIDMMSYAGIVRETGSINPGQATSEVGIDDGGGADGYVAFGKWRYTSKPVAGQAFEDCAGGGVEMGIVSITASFKGTYIIEVDQDLFNYASSGIGQEFADLGTKAWHEPYYIVNIVEDLEADQQDINAYVDAGHYQKVEATIGITNGLLDQVLQLVDERPDDCCNINDTSIDRFIYLNTPDGLQEQWLDVKNKSALFIVAELIAIAAGTSPYGGLYSHQVDGTGRFYTIEFSITGSVPVQDSLVLVKYDSRIPIQVFTGQTFINRQVMEAIDITQSKKFDLGYPYYRVKINDNFRLFSGDAGTAPWHNMKMEFLRQLTTLYISENRWCTNLDYTDNLLNDKQHFPNTNYVIRTQDGSLTAVDTAPYIVDYEEGTNAPLRIEGGFRFQPQTNIDYSHYANKIIYFSRAQVGFKDVTFFCTGMVWSAERNVGQQNAAGVRTFPALNFITLDDRQGEIKYAWAGFTNRYGDNLYVFAESGLALMLVNQVLLRGTTGESTGGFDQGTGFIQGHEIWISRMIGMDSEYWMTAVEANNVVFFTNRQSVFAFDGNEPLNIANRTDGDRINGYHSKLYPKYLSGAGYNLFEEVTSYFDVLHEEYAIQIRDKSTNIDVNDTLKVVYFVTTITGTEQVIVVDGEAVIINESFDVNLTFALDMVGKTFHVANASTTNVINVNTFILVPPIAVLPVTTIAAGATKTFLITSLTTTVDITVTDLEAGFVTEDKEFVFSKRNGGWEGEYDYRYDRYLSFNNSLYGSRNLTTLELNKGNTINGANIDAHVLVPFSSITRNQYIRVQSHSGEVSPTTIRFYETIAQYDADAHVSEILAVNMEHFDGFEQYVEPNASDEHLQGNLIYVRIQNNIDEGFSVTAAGLQQKRLK